MAVRSGVMTDDVESRDRSELQKTPMPTRHAKKAKTYTHTHTHTPYSLARLGVGPRRTRLSRVTRRSAVWTLSRLWGQVWTLC
jgi:hypothetical protein